MSANTRFNTVLAVHGCIRLQTYGMSPPGIDASRLWSAASTSSDPNADSSDGSDASLLCESLRMRSAEMSPTTAGSVDRPQWLRFMLRSWAHARPASEVRGVDQKLPKPCPDEGRTERYNGYQEYRIALCSSSHVY